MMRYLLTLRHARTLKRTPWTILKKGFMDKANKCRFILTMSELKGLTLMLRMELLVRDHTLVLCLKAALTWEKEIKVRLKITNIDNIRVA